jgi:transposase
MQESMCLWKESGICVIDANGKVVGKARFRANQRRIAWLSEVGVTLTRIGLEAGPLSQWLYAAMRQAALAVELLETRHVRNAFKIMPVKTDRKEARGIAELMRLGWFRPVHCKSMEAQETRAMLTARKLVQTFRPKPRRLPRRVDWPTYPLQYLVRMR